MASTNKTEHLGLNQWVLTDPFLMEDFNEDNRKIDTAVAAINLRGYIAGSYNGNNCVDTPQAVELGFKPSAVLICQPGKSLDEYGVFLTSGAELSYNGMSIAKLTETGFEVCMRKNGSSALKPMLTSGSPFCYIAFK